MFFPRFLLNIAGFVPSKFVGVLALLVVLQTVPSFADASGQENPYSEIRELSYSKFSQLFKEYIDKNDLRNRNGHYMGKTCDVVHFLEQFVNLEKFTFGLFPYPCKVELEEFTSNPPHLPNLKSLILRNNFSSHDLGWLTTYPLLEILSIYNFKEIDVSPLQSMEHLSDLYLLRGVANAKVTQANRLPLSLKCLYVVDGYIDCSEINHLKLKELWLSSRYITTLPKKSALAELEDLDLSGSSISDLSPIEGNLSLKGFTYDKPVGDGVRANFSILNTLANLENLCLLGFPQGHEELENAIKDLSKLRNLTLQGQKLFDLSCLEGLNLQVLAVAGRLLSSIPDSILQNPSLTELITTELELADSTFSWNQISPNIRDLSLGYSDFCDFADLSRFPLVSLECGGVDCIDNEEQLMAFAPTLESLTCKGSMIYSLIDRCGDDALASFVRLKHLDIDFDENNKFDSLSFLRKMPALEELEIDSARRIPPEAFDIFLEMKNLKKVVIWDTSFEINMKITELLKNGVPIK